MNNLSKDKKSFLAAIFILVILISNVGLSQPIYVKWDAAGSGNGSSWTDAYTNLQDALSSAAMNDTIYVAKGTYYPDRGNGIQQGDRNASFTLKDGVVVLGGYAGTEDFQFIGVRWRKGAGDWHINKTILSGDLSGNDNEVIAHDEPTRSENSIHIITVTQPYDSITEINGFYIEGGNANTTSDLSGAYGGAVNFNGTQFNIKNCLFRKNSALEGGGAIYSNTGTLKIKSCVFSGNTSKTGGAVSLSGSDDIMNSVMHELLNSYFSNNTATDMGGALYLSAASDARIFNNVFYENSTSGETSTGGSVYADAKSYPQAINNTFYKNNSAGFGGGLAFFAGTVSNSIFRNNTAVSDAQIYIAGEPSNTSALREVSNSAIEGGFTGTRIYDTDPGFLMAENPAGADNLPGTFDDGLQLSSSSILIDSGLAVNNFQSDARGLVRFAKGQVDIGAYEYQRFNLDFKKLAEDLKSGGYTLLFNHTMTIPTEIDSPGHEVDLHWCWMQKNISREGHDQAKYLGSIIRVMQIEYDPLLCSPMCRTKESTRLMFGRDSTDHDIFRSSFVWLKPDSLDTDKRLRLGTAPTAGKNAVIVTRGNVISKVTSLSEEEVKEGDVIIIKPLGGQQYELVSHLTTDSWERLYRLTLESTDVDGSGIQKPTDYALYENYPNPFNPETNIKFRIAQQGKVSLKIYDVLGKEIATLLNEEKQAGEYNIKFNAVNLASGIYFYSINAGSFSQTKKLVLMK